MSRLMSEITLSETVAAWRRDNSLTQKDAAVVLGILQSSISRMEAGGWPDDATVAKLVRQRVFTAQRYGEMVAAKIAAAVAA